jgi:hypothetical protein
VKVCEVAIPVGTTKAKIGNFYQYVAPSTARIVAFGDSGCNQTVDAGCRTSGWPFQAISDMAASMKPTLIIHVGDCQYRSYADGTSKCPFFPGTAANETDEACDTWDTWEQDLFKPSEALMKVAPWAMTRGNHENCTGAYRGYFLFLHPGSLPASDADCAAIAPYIVTASVATPAAGTWSYVVIDTSDAQTPGLASVMQSPTPPAGRGWFVTHVPFDAGGPVWDALAGHNISLVLAGHIHLWGPEREHTTTPQFIVGTGGADLSPPVRGIAAWGFTLFSQLTPVPASGIAWVAAFYDSTQIK